MKILHIESSIFAEQGVSSQLAHELIEQLMQQNPSAQLTTRRFADQPVPHLNSERLTAINTSVEQRTRSQQTLANYSDQQIAEIQETDILVLGLPMYNFSVPSMLKAWFDHIARAGVTFQYTDKGPEGLLKNKKAYLIATRGGAYKDTHSDTQTPFVKAFLNFIGISDIEFIYAEQLNMGHQNRENSLAVASNHIKALAGV